MQLPGRVVYRGDFSGGARGFATANYQNRLTMGVTEGVYRVTKTNADKKTGDTAWSLQTPSFAVTPGAEFAVFVSCRGDAGSMENPQGSGTTTFVGWLDAEERPLQTQDVWGRPVSLTFPFGFRSEGAEWIESAACGTVPLNAKRAVIRVGADTPNVPFGKKIEFRRLAFAERVDGKPWDLSPFSRLLEARETVGKMDFSRFNGKPSAKGVITIREDGVFLRDGKPFFPLGPAAMGKCPLNGFSYDKAVADLKAMGCTVGHTYLVTTDKAINEYFEACRKHDFMTMVEISARTLKGEKRDQTVAANVNAMRDRNLIFAWGVGDDTADHRTPEEVMRDTMIVHAADPTAKTISIDGMQYPGRQYPFAHCCDIVGPELYPYRNPVPEKDALDKVVTGMQVAIGDNARAGVRNRGYVPFLQSFRGWGAWKRYPTFDEVRSESYASIAAGARGLVYYTYYSGNTNNAGVASSPENFAAFGRLMRELSSLADDFTAFDAKVQPTAKVLSGPAKSPMGRDAVLLLRKDSPSKLLIAVNLAAGEVRAEIAVGGADEAEVVGENRTVDCRNGRLTDTFAAGATHVYRFRLPKSVPAAAVQADPAFAVSLTPGATGVYSLGETAELTLVASNRTAAAADVRVLMRTVDYFGQTVATDERTVSVPAGGVVSNVIACAALTAPGHYCTVADWEAAGTKGVAEGAFVRVGPKPAKADTLFGITCYENGPADLYAKLGVGTKGYTFVWNWLEDRANPGPENCRFEKIVKYVDELRAAGIRVFGMVSTRNSYAPRRYRKAKVAKGEDSIADVPKYYADLEVFYRHLVRTFKGRIDAWACGEEINLVASQNPYAYQRCIDVTRIFARAAREEDPGVKVFGASVSGGDGRSMPPFPWLRRILPELKDSLDGITPDQYTDGQLYGEGYENCNSEQTRLREIMQEVMAIADANGVSGVGIDEKGPSYVNALPIASERSRFCADIVAREFIILKTLPRVRHWLYYDMYLENKEVITFGTWKSGSPRQAAAAYAATARLMAGAEFVKELGVHGDIPCWVFRKDGRFFATLWYNGNDAPLAFALAARPSVACDVMGNALACAGNAVALSSSPTYVYFDSLETLERAVSGAAFDVPRVSAALETLSADCTALVVRNLTNRPLEVRVTDFRTEPACARPAALDAPIALGPFEAKTVDLPYAAAASELALACGAGRPVRVRAEFRPVRVKRVSAWEDLAGADEIRLDDPAIQVPGYADLVSHRIYEGLDDLSARARIGHDGTALWLEFTVKDDIHYNGISSRPCGVWNGDSVQYAFDARHNARLNLMAGKRGYDADDYNFCSGLMNGRPVTYCYVAAEANRKRLQDTVREEPEIVRDEQAKETRYRIRIPFADLAPFVPAKGRALGFSFIVFDHDPPGKGSCRMELTPGIATPIDPAKYKTLVLE